MDQSIILPRIYGRTPGNRQAQLGGETGYPDGSNTFLQGNIVVLTTGSLACVVTDGVLACGLAADASNADSSAFPTNPPYDLYGNHHYPFDLHGLWFYINIGTLDGGGAAVVGEANSAKQISDVAVGTTYAIATATSGTYSGYQFLDPTDTTNKLLTVVGIPSLQGVTQSADGGIDQQTTATYNGIVIATINDAYLQAIN